MVKRIQRKKTQVSKYLIIVESPNKVRHIQEFVGSQYRVMASVGHIRQINDSGKYKIGVDYDDNFKTDYIVDPKKKDIVKELKSAVKDAEIVYLASDDDSEGEAIAWHLKDTLKIPSSKLKRAIFKEITKTTLQVGMTLASVGYLGALGYKHLGALGSLLGMGLGTAIGAGVPKLLFEHSSKIV